jgi:hypothetical protein
MNKNLKNVLYIIGIFFIIYILSLFNKCSESKTTVKHNISIPEYSGSFEKPTNIVEITKIKDSIIYRNQKIFTDSPVNKALVEQYLKATDSIKRLKLYLESIGEKEVNYTFDNTDVNIEVYTKTRGTILEIKPKYTIKQKDITVDVPNKETVFALYGGAEIGNSTSLDNLILKADVGIQNRKGTIFTVGADNNSNYYIGAKVRILNIKK